MWQYCHISKTVVAMQSLIIVLLVTAVLIMFLGRTHYQQVPLYGAGYPAGGTGWIIFSLCLLGILYAREASTVLNQFLVRDQSLQEFTQRRPPDTAFVSDSLKCQDTLSYMTENGTMAVALDSAMNQDSIVEPTSYNNTFPQQELDTLFTVQLGAFTIQGNARRLLENAMHRTGVGGWIQQSDTNRELFKVRIGVFKEEWEAESLRIRLVSTGFNKGFVDSLTPVEVSRFVP